MRQGKLRAEKKPVRNATSDKAGKKFLVEMDSDEVLEKYGKSVAGGERKKTMKMSVSGKSVFKIREIILKKSQKAKK